VDDEDEDEDEQGTAIKSDPAKEASRHMVTTKFAGVTTGIIVAGLAVAMVIDELEVVLGFVGSTGSTIISFILPGLFYFTLFRSEAGKTKWFALALTIYGVFVMVFCLSFNIYKLVTRSAVGVSHIMRRW